MGTDEGAFQIFYATTGEASEPGPKFATLEEALQHAARNKDRRCDVRLPDGKWYAKQETVGIATLEAAADEAIASIEWMKSGPSRTSGKRNKD